MLGIRYETLFLFVEFSELSAYVCGSIAGRKLTMLSHIVVQLAFPLKVNL